jgi:hypothetical protein
MLTLNITLLELYWKFLFSKDILDNNERKQVATLFNYIQMPIKISTHQHSRFKNPQLAKQQGHFFKITNKGNDDELVRSTLLKLMLVDKILSSTFTTLNIFELNKNLDIKFSATYLNRINKSNAQEHIKSLLEDAKWIRIIDRYIAENRSQWSEYKTILENILPNNSITITIQSNPQINQEHKNDLKSLFDNCKDIKGQSYNLATTHDRYIETDKIKILLSSGLYHLSSSSNMDFTYIISLK